MFWLVSFLIAAAQAAPVQVPEKFDLPFAAANAVDAGQWQQSVRARLFEIVEAQNPRRDTPLDVKPGEFADAEGFKKAPLTFTGNEGQAIDCWLTRPDGDGPFPAIVCLHGHGGDRDKVHDPASIYKGLGTEFAKRGFVTIAPTLAHYAYAPNQLWNLMRLVDVLDTLPYVDKTRIGVAGLSMGGEWSMWLAACDTRVSAAVVSGWTCSTEGVLRWPNCPCWMPPGLLELCDIAEVHVLIAPRPLLVENAIGDGCFPIDATQNGFDKIVRGYTAFGAVDKVRRHTFPGGHAWSGEQAYPFIEKALKPRD
jgi:dienelactone hydrolase